MFQSENSISQRNNLSCEIKNSFNLHIRTKNKSLTRKETENTVIDKRTI